MSLPRFTTQVEVFSETLAEMKPLFRKHYDRLSLNAKQAPLDPDYETYFAVEKQGRLLLVTLRDWRGKLAGYWILFIGPALHSKGVLTAIMDLWHIEPEHMGGTAPLRLIKAVKAELLRRGVQRWFAGEAIHVPCGRLFEAVGMERVECTYTVWLGGA